MSVFCNGDFVKEEEARVSVFDRSFLYGDGLFASIRVCQRNLFRWEEHWQRVLGGAEFLGIPLPFSMDQLKGSAQELVAQHPEPNASLRLTISRGTGAAGYSPLGAAKPLVLMWLRPLPPVDPVHPAKWRLATSSHRVLADSLLTRFKTANKLAQVLARKEAAESGADEALLLNGRGEVAEAAASNVFWIDQEGVGTPPLRSGALDGVTRAAILELCRALGVPCREAVIGPECLTRAQGIFCTLSSLGLVEVVELDGIGVERAELSTRLHRAYHALLAAETATKI